MIYAAYPCWLDKVGLVTLVECLDIVGLCVGPDTRDRNVEDYVLETFSLSYGCMTLRAAVNVCGVAGAKLPQWPLEIMLQSSGQVVEHLIKQPLNKKVSAQVVYAFR